MTSIRAVGVDDAEQLLEGIADRAEDLRPAWDDVQAELLQVQAGYWLTGGTWGVGSGRRDPRDGDARYMVDTGGTLASVTRPGAAGQVDERRPESFTFGTDLEQAREQAGRGRSAIAEPTGRDADRYAEQVGDFLLFG